MTVTRYFYPRSPCGERQINRKAYGKDVLFLSTLSLRRATGGRQAARRQTVDFYPRSPCGERRPRLYPSRGRNRNFYPRSPCGERLAPSCPAVDERLRSFLSTLSLRRATAAIGKPTLEIAYFYPRSPCGERQCNNLFSGRVCYFYPRSPCGERPAVSVLDALDRDFYPRSPCGERHQPLVFTAA